MFRRCDCLLLLLLLRLLFNQVLGLTNTSKWEKAKDMWTCIRKDAAVAGRVTRGLGWFVLQLQAHQQTADSARVQAPPAAVHCARHTCAPLATHPPSLPSPTRPATQRRRAVQPRSQAPGELCLRRPGRRPAQQRRAGRLSAGSRPGRARLRTRGAVHSGREEGGRMQAQAQGCMQVQDITLI